MFGQPYDESAIPKGQEFYLNGWDNGDDDVTLAGKSSWVEQAPPRNGTGGADWDDPWAKAWKLDWGKGGFPAGPAGQAKTMEWRWGRDGAGLASRGGMRNALGYGLTGVDAATGMQELSYNASGGGGEGDSAGGVKAAAWPWNSTGLLTGTMGQQAISATGFAKEVEKEARENGDNPELARKKGIDAGWRYIGYLTGTAGAGLLAAKLRGDGWAAMVGLGGAAAGEYKVKPRIKQHVLGKSAADYEQNEEPLFPGNTPPGPG